MDLPCRSEPGGGGGATDAADQYPADRDTVERSGGDVKIKNLTAFVAVVDAGMHAPRAAQALGVGVVRRDRTDPGPEAGT